MNKEYMLQQIRARIKLLRERIKETITSTEMKGTTAQFYRTNMTKELRLCLLIEQLLIMCPPFMLDDEQMIKGFDQLVSPIERHRRIKNDSK